MSYCMQQIRNVALAGHPGVGKTTLFEALLHAGGALKTAGTIERGTTVSDHDPLEKQRGHSIDSALASIDLPDMRLNLLDTPGYPEFRGATLSALAVVETAIIVIDASRGIEFGTRRILQRANERGLCRAIVANKIDHDDADCAALLQALRKEFGQQVLPLNLPADSAKRVVDCFSDSQGDSDLGPVAAWHQLILDQVVEINETVMEHYLDLGEDGLSGDELHTAFEQCLREGHLLPVCFVSARNGVGVPELLQIARRLLPAPQEGNPPLLLDADLDAPIALSTAAQAPVIANVFRILNDPFVGKVSLFRVYQGTVIREMNVLLGDTRKPVKLAHLFRIQGKEHLPTERVVAGDIAAVAKLEELYFGAMLHERVEHSHLQLRPIEFPRAMFGLAIAPASRGQEHKLALALERVAQEDPALRIEQQVETHETVLHGLSDLHLRVTLERLESRHGVEVTTRPPRIPYRETISSPAEGHYRHKKQSGGAGQFGEVALRIVPLPRGSGFEFVNEVKGGVIPGQFMPAVEKGVRQALERGAIAGFRMQDVKVVIHDGRYHAVDSKEIAFITAARKAFLGAVANAGPQVLEPITTLKIIAPEALAGAITGGLAAKRAHINGTDTVAGDIIISAYVPLSELEGYAAELKAATAGRGRYTMEFSHYEPVSAATQQRLIAAHRPHPEDD